jgi:hypothetical protein
MLLARAALVAAIAMLATGSTACSSVSTVRLHSEAVHVGPGLRPIAGIQANAISAYVLFIPVPGGVDLDRVVNRMLVATAKAMGADKVAELRFDISPSTGIWALRKLAGWRSAQASGVAVQITGPAPDPDAEQGPEADVDAAGSTGDGLAPASAP